MALIRQRRVLQLCTVPSALAPHSSICSAIPAMRSASSSFILHPRLPGKVCLAFRLGFHFLDYSLPLAPFNDISFFFFFSLFYFFFVAISAVLLSSWAWANEHVTPFVAFRFYYYALAHIPVESEQNIKKNIKLLYRCSNPTPQAQAQAPAPALARTPTII